MAAISEYHGSLVAFEGSQDIISTQLRLLPNSPNILIIPPLRYFMRDENVGVPFDVRRHILAMHDACSDRAEIARAFLGESTPCNKRLVFMNGGTASAQVECVAAISERVTNGDFGKAERIFNRLIRNGVAGLRSQPEPDMEPKASNMTTIDQQQSEQDEEVAGDPATEAMRAAEALDFETASLQPNDEVDLTSTTRPRSTSVPVFRMTDDFQNTAPFYLFGARRLQKKEARNSAPPQIPYRSHTTQESRESPQWLLSPATSPTTINFSHPSSPNGSREEKARIQVSSTSIELSSPSTLGFESVPNTPAICEAFVVNIRSSASTASHKKKTKSVDKIYSSAIRNQDILLCSFPEPPRSRPQGGKTSPISHEETPTSRAKFTSEIPRPTFSTPGRSTVRRGPPSPLKLIGPLQRPVTYVDRSTSPRNNYVDRGTTTEPEPTPSEAGTGDNASIDVSDNFEMDSQRPHESLFPMIEDLVILFKAEKTDTRLETTIQAFREGKYPISMPSSRSETDADSNRRSTSSLGEPQPTPRDDKNRMSRVQHAEVTPAGQTDSDDYDPYAYGKYLRPPRSWSSRQNLNGHRPFTPPTPAQTPPLTTKRSEKCFHDFTTTNYRTAVCMQNSLRSILNIYFPPEDAGYHQFNFPLLPELSSLWKPVFREMESGTVIQKRRKVDLILAIGAQQGVDSTFLGAISGSLEKLGTKPNGVTRSGRLDMRYLIASAMQAFTSQPLTNQTHDNPFSNPLLLATLIIPHLETYMAAHSATRFLLLEYPPEHLTTVLALQHLVGADLLRIAGILYSEDTGPKPYPGFKIPPRSSATPPLQHTRSAASATLLSPTSGTRGMECDAPPSTFAKANFLLTSSANESEIATLISTVWKILIESSTFYIPEGVAMPRSSIQVDRDKGREGERETRRESQARPLAQTPLINTAQQYAPLANAAASLGFQGQDGVEGSVSTECVVGVSQSQYIEASPPPPPPKQQRGAEATRVERVEAQLKSTRGSVAETIRSHSSRTARTMRSQRNKIRTMLGREQDTDADVFSSRADAGSLIRERERDRGVEGDEEYWWDEADDDGFAAEERKYMPLYGRQHGPRKGSSRKALKWLGLAT
ncbi:hypothetical protein F5Y04DRAFT_62588 [Hypomontagnella monticulosa]|nr:hypothetical protein F5Y04DRAFT_62588 [Hypomontagnella monticulosa]